MTARARQGGSQRGQSVVEVALMAPFLLGLLVSAIDIGRLEHYNTSVGSSARAGVQYGAQTMTTVVDLAGMATAAQNDAQNLTGLTATGYTLCKCSDGSAATCQPASSCPVNTHMLTYAKVVSSYTFTTLFNYRVIPSTINLSRTEIMQVGQ